VLMLPLLIQAQEDDELEIPMPPGAQEDELVVPLVPDNAVVVGNGDVLIIGTANPPTEELIEYPVTPGAGADPCAPTGDELAVPLVDCPTVTPPPTQQQPINLIRGYYRQVSTSLEQEGICYDTSVDAVGACAADREGHNEVHDYNNCWSEDADADGDGVRDEHLVPVCQSDDTETLFLYDEGYLYGRLSGRAYGRASMNRTMLEQGGVSIGTYSVLQGTQIEILSSTRFVVRQVHRENGGCVRTFNMFYELAGESEAACQQVIEVAPEDLPEDPISTPPPLPPVASEPYRVSMPIIPDTCTEDTMPPADFNEAQLALDNSTGTLTVTYGSGTFTTYQNMGSTFSFVDRRQGVFLLDFTLFDGRVDMKWYKSNSSGGSCTVEGELRPLSADVSAPPADSPMAAIENGATYNVTWTPLPDACPAEMRALTPNFIQATVTTESDRFTIDYGTGSYTLLDEYGIGMFSYTVYGED
jgi:hypothetical protein